MDLNLPNLSLIVLIGASGSGKSTFARTHFLPTEVLSSDYCRAIVADDENDQSATKDAFEILHFIAAKRLAAGRLTVIDATNVQADARKPLIELARQFHVLPVAIVFDLPERICQERNDTRPDRNFGPHVIRRQSRDLRGSLRTLRREGFRHTFVLHSLDEVDAATVVREPLWNDRRAEHGPFDIVGDIHGCFDELCELLTALGYTVADQDGAFSVTPPDNRKLVFLGDLVDRGPKTPDVLRLVMDATESGAAICVPGNHDSKLLRALLGKPVTKNHGLAESLAQLDAEAPEFRARVVTFLDSLVSHYVFDDGRLVVAHAGMKESMQGRGSASVREFALYGETTGETDEFGLPVRYNWAAEYRGRATVVYGHTPIPEPEWLNHTINIDTGCVFGGRLTALRWPERQLVSVPAAQIYAEPARPFLPADAVSNELSAQHAHDDLIDIESVTGKRFISTRLHRNVAIRAENAAAALEVMSRFAVNPKWLIYLPPTMSPPSTTHVDGLLEHPAEAFGYFRDAGITRVVCEEKHMGSRAVVVVCRSEEVARERFGVIGEGIGVVVTRTGRRFFPDDATQAALLARLQGAAERANLFDELTTDWLCLDCELMPWSAKASALLRHQYAAVGASSTTALSAAVAALSAVAGDDANTLRDRFAARAEKSELFVDAYRRYCWPVESLDDYKLAPFHLLASENAVHIDKDHEWHMSVLSRLSADDPIFVATPYRVVDLTDESSEADATRWWAELTDGGGEGMVVKPHAFVAIGNRGMVQPAIKCRGREYLRIIYGPEYDAPEHLSRLRSRSVAAKRSLALREFALGIESLERFVRREPLYRTHECVFGVLALESEPIDPRL